MDNSNRQELAMLQLGELKSQYDNSLPEELDKLKILAAALGSKNVAPAVCKELHSKLHKLTGSAGTFGYDRLSEKTRLLEYKVNKWVDLDSNKILQKELGQFIQDIGNLTTFINERNRTIVIDSGNNRRDSDNATQNDTLVIWIIEDEPLLGQVLQRQIESFGYQVILFESVDSVRSLVKQKMPSLFLIDVIFERENINLTESIQHIPEIKEGNCPIIFMSAYDDFESRIRAAKLDAQGYFIKPLDVPRLINHVTQIFEKLNAPPKRVLIVDDDIHTSEHYRLVLESAGLNVAILHKGRNIIEKVEAFRPELIFIDLYMPDYFGPDLAAVLRQYDKFAGIPIVFLSSETDLTKQAEAMKLGADDFLTKPISDQQLVNTATLRVDRSRQLNALISKDSLTGLLKHSSIKEALNIQVQRASRTNKPLCIAMIDIDNFKLVNDLYGHATGDIVICSVAMLLRQRLRQSDIIGRYGGEEFVVVLPECDLDSAKEILNDIRTHFCEILFQSAKEKFNCFFSCGIACSTTFKNVDGEQLLCYADNSLYKAKHQGRNQVQVATENDALKSAKNDS